MIASPLKDQIIWVSPSNPIITIRGVAMGNGGDGARVVKVEVSFDEGETW